MTTWKEKLTGIMPEELAHEIDVFEGDNEGLVIAEVELHSEDELFDRPEWLGEEVTYDARYTNSSLAKCPFQQWHQP